MEKAEVSIKDTRISEATKNLVYAFNHITVLMSGANGEERVFLNQVFKDLNAIRLQFVQFYSKENREKRSQTQPVEIQETPPDVDLNREALEALLKAELSEGYIPSEPPEGASPEELQKLMAERNQGKE